MAKSKNTLVFLDVSIDGDPFERMIFELLPDVAPKTVENFRALCTGEKGTGPRSGKPLHYKGSFFHRIIKGSMAQGGDFVERNGTSGESIYAGKFPDEPPRLKHDEPGLLSMSIADRDNLGSQFIITFKANHHLDRKYVVFGKLIEGDEVLKQIESVGNDEGNPTVTVKIINCGEFKGGKKKLSKLKMGKNASSDVNNHEARKKGKHKKSSRDRKKRRRRYYSSDSESSSDSEMESSETDSITTESYESSSEISSSSDDRRKKRKKSSRRDKHRRGRKRDKRREKRRRRRDKKSRRRSRRSLDILTEDESESGSSSDDGGLGAKTKDQKQTDPFHNTAGDQSPMVLEEEIPSDSLKKRQEPDTLEKEEGEFPKENGGQRSNGIEADAKSDESQDVQPMIQGFPQQKSRSRSISPKRSMSKSMSISPRRMSRTPSRSSRSRSPARSVSKSPPRSQSPASSASRSPEGSQSPARSVSGSPVRSRSPVRSPVRARSRRTSRSPVGSPPRRNTSRSPPRTSRKLTSRSPLTQRSNSRSPVRAPSRTNRRSYSRSPAIRRARSPLSDRRSFSRSPSPDGSPKRIRRGRGFSDKYSYARRYQTPTPERSPVRPYRYGSRNDRDRYSSYRRYSPKRYRSPPRSTPRYRGRRSRSRSPSVSHSPRRRSHRYGRSRSVSRSRSPAPRSRPSPWVERRRSPSRSRTTSASHSSLNTQSPKRLPKERSPSSSGSPNGEKGLVSYGEASPDSQR